MTQTSTVHFCKSCLGAFKSLSEVKFSAVICLPLGQGCRHCPALGLQEAKRHPFSDFFPAAWRIARSSLVCCAHLSHSAEVCQPPEDGARECWRGANGRYLFPHDYHPSVALCHVWEGSRWAENWNTGKQVLLRGKERKHKVRRETLRLAPGKGALHESVVTIHGKPRKRNQAKRTPVRRKQ